MEEEHDNMTRSLKGKKVAALIAHGFEQIELIEPQKALQGAGATVDIVSLERGAVRGWNRTDWGADVPVDRTVDECRAEEYDALLLPGGVMNPDKLRMNQKAVQFVRAFYDQGKPIAAICHAPWMLVEADVVRGCRVTSYPSVATDLRNAGADWTDSEVVVDRGVVTSRKPDDIPAFNNKMIEEFAEGQHGGAGRRQPARAAGASTRG
jgi:protease I